MSIEGVDFSWSRPTVAQLHAAGKKFACRYLNDPGGKGLTRGELASYTLQRFPVVLNFESSGHTWRGGYAAGVRDGREAVSLRAALGLSDPVYFSVDEDPTAAGSPGLGTAEAYFRGVESVLGHAGTGDYGSYALVQHLASAGVCALHWQTYAWSGRNLSPHANLYQWWNGRDIAGSSVDFTRALTDYFGQHPAPAQVAGVTPDIPTSTAPVERDYYKEYDMARNVGIYKDETDPKNKKITRTYAIFNPESGFWTETFNGDGAGPLPSEYVNGLAAAFDTRPWASVTPAGYQAIKTSVGGVK